MGSYHATLPHRISPGTVSIPADSIAAVDLRFRRLTGYRPAPLSEEDRADGMRLYERTMALLEQTPRAQRSYPFRARRTANRNPGYGKNPFTGEPIEHPGPITLRRLGIETRVEEEQAALLATIERHPWAPDAFPQHERAKAVHLWVLIQACVERMAEVFSSRSAGGLIAGSLRVIRGKILVPKEAQPLARHVTLLMRTLRYLLERFAVPRPANSPFPAETGTETGAALLEVPERPPQIPKASSKWDGRSLQDKKQAALAELYALFPDFARARTG